MLCRQSYIYDVFKTVLKPALSDIFVQKGEILSGLKTRKNQSRAKQFKFHPDQILTPRVRHTVKCKQGMLKVRINGWRIKHDYLICKKSQPTGDLFTESVFGFFLLNLLLTSCVVFLLTIWRCPICRLSAGTVRFKMLTTECMGIWPSYYTECPQGMTCLGFGRVSFFSSVSQMCTLIYALNSVLP